MYNFDGIDWTAIVMLIKGNWSEFVEYCGNEESAELALREFKKITGQA